MAEKFTLYNMEILKYTRLASEADFNLVSEFVLGFSIIRNYK